MPNLCSQLRSSGTIAASENLGNGTTKVEVAQEAFLGYFRCESPQARRSQENTFLIHLHGILGNLESYQLTST